MTDRDSREPIPDRSHDADGDTAGPPPVIVRLAVAEDIASVGSIYWHHVLHGTATFEEEPPTLDEMAARWRSVCEIGLPFLVAERRPSRATPAAGDAGATGLGTAILGYAYASRYRPRSAYRYTLESSVYLDPGETGRGTGTLLMRSLLDRCSGGPWRQMVAVIGDSANHASIRLHERLGFRLVGTLRDVGFKHGRWLDTVVMQRPLENAEEPGAPDRG